MTPPLHRRLLVTSFLVIHHLLTASSLSSSLCSSLLDLEHGCEGQPPCRIITSNNIKYFPPAVISLKVTKLTSSVILSILDDDNNSLGCCKVGHEFSSTTLQVQLRKKCSKELSSTAMNVSEECVTKDGWLHLWMTCTEENELRFAWRLERGKAKDYVTFPGHRDKSKMVKVKGAGKYGYTPLVSKSSPQTTTFPSMPLPDSCTSKVNTGVGKRGNVEGMIGDGEKNTEVTQGGRKAEKVGQVGVMAGGGVHVAEDEGKNETLAGDTTGGEVGEVKTVWCRWLEKKKRDTLEKQRNRNDNDRNKEEEEHRTSCVVAKWLLRTVMILVLVAVVGSVVILVLVVSGANKTNDHLDDYRQRDFNGTQLNQGWRTEKMGARVLYL